MEHFKNKNVIVTGGNSGIGEAVVSCFITEGANVIVCSLDNTNISKRLKKCKKQKIIKFVGDLSKESCVIRLIKKGISKLGKIDILVNCAGISESEEIENITLKKWNYIIKNNLTNCFLCCKHVLPHMKKRNYGKIINFSSIAGRFRSKSAGLHYTSAKAGIIAFTRQLASEAPYINVNVVCPGHTNTPMLAKHVTPEIIRKVKKSIPLGYIASPIQQAKVVLFLASEDSNYMTGAVIDVNGGQL